jgi:crotonobetainyl-CoA:carnitine CoA-transferase CaiB-like acyl-CoA transferase
MLAPYEIFQAADAPVFIACGNDRLFARLAAALGRADLAEDVRFAENARRVAHRDLLHATLEQCTREWRAPELVGRLRDAGVPVSPVHDIAQLLADPQVDALQLHHLLPLVSTTGTRADARAVGMPLRLDGERAFAAAVPVAVGQDSEAVLAGAGYGHEDIQRLVEQGVVEV